MGKDKGKQSGKASKNNNAANAASKGKAPEAEGFDKKLDGPNRPSI